MLFVIVFNLERCVLVQEFQFVSHQLVKAWVMGDTTPGRCSTTQHYCWTFSVEICLNKHFFLGPNRVLSLFSQNELKTIPRFYRVTYEI